MAVIKHYMEAARYERGLRLLELAYATASVALNDQIEHQIDDIIGHRDAIEAGEIVDEIDYNDGYVIITRSMSMNLRADALRDASSETRAAFVMALFHHWERSVCLWAGKHLSNFAEQVKAVRALDYPLHPRIEAVHQLANLLKHNNDIWGHRLMQSWSSVFKLMPEPQASNVDWYSILELTDAHLDEIIAILQGCSPTFQAA